MSLEKSADELIAMRFAEQMSNVNLHLLYAEYVKAYWVAKLSGHEGDVEWYGILKHYIKEEADRRGIHVKETDERT